MSQSASHSVKDVYFRRIGWRDTASVIKLSHSLLPRELCRATHSLFALFVNFERQNTNLSFGLFVEGKMVGYMLVYFLDRSLYHDRDERIVHIDEYCVMPAYRGRGREVISRMVHEFGLFQKCSGIEAIATGGALEHWLSIGRIVTRWGYETNVRENDCERAGHSMGRIRWEFKTGENWRPDTPMKLPKPVAQLPIKENHYSLLIVRNTRQWLSLKPFYSTLHAKHGESWFEYAWQWWAHFGISEELNVITLLENDTPVCILPLSLKPSVQSGHTSTLSPMASNSSYPTVPALFSSGSKSQLSSILTDLIGCHPELQTMNLLDVVQRLFSEGLTGAASLPFLENRSLPFGWFGLHRRELELHKSFIASVVDKR